MRTLVCPLLLAFACASEPPSQLRPPTHFELLRERAPETSALPESKAAAMISLCCPPDRMSLRRESDAGCFELARMVEQEPTSEVFQGWKPRCEHRVPPSAFLPALTDNRVRDDAAHLLGEMEPDAMRSATMFSALLQMDLPGTGSQNQRHEVLLTELALSGERELAAIARGAPGRATSFWAMRVFQRAIELGPLDAEALGDGIPSPVRAAIRIKLFEQINIDDRAFALIGPDGVGKLGAIKLLSRRRSFCRSFVATAILGSFTLDGDEHVASLARRALATRAERCGALLATEPPRTEIEAILRLR